MSPWIRFFSEWKVGGGVHRQNLYYFFRLLLFVWRPAMHNVILPARVHAHAFAPMKCFDRCCRFPFDAFMLGAVSYFCLHNCFELIRFHSSEWHTRCLDSQFAFSVAVLPFVAWTFVSNSKYDPNAIHETVTVYPKLHLNYCGETNARTEQSMAIKFSARSVPIYIDPAKPTRMRQSSAIKIKENGTQHTCNRFPFARPNGIYQFYEPRQSVHGSYSCQFWRYFSYRNRQYQPAMATILRLQRWKSNKWSLKQNGNDSGERSGSLPHGT